MAVIDTSVLPSTGTVSNVLEMMVTRSVLQAGKHTSSAVPWTFPRIPQRATFLTISCVSLTITLYLFYRRCRRLTLKSIRGMTYIRSLVIMSYILAITFTTVSLSLVVSGISSLDLCRNAIYVCIGFLFSGKICTQLFLIERAHVANINYLRRRDDPIWWFSIIMSALAGVALAVWTYINPVFYMDPVDGRCRKGLPPSVVAPIQAFEIVLNITLTIVFVRILRRSRMCQFFPERPQKMTTTTSGGLHYMLRRVRNPNSRAAVCARAAASAGKSVDGGSMEVVEVDGPRGVETSTLAAKMDTLDLESDADEVAILPASTRPSRLRNLALKSLIGTLFFLGWTITNSIIFYVMQGREHAWLCYVQCNLDVTFSVWVLHWLTAHPREPRGRCETRLSVIELPSCSGKPTVTKLRPKVFVTKDGNARWVVEGVRTVGGDAADCAESSSAGSSAGSADSAGSWHRGDSIVQVRVKFPAKILERFVS